VLEARVGASHETLKANYRRLSLALHPDKRRDGHAAFCRLQRAWETLREPEARDAYDRSLVVERDDASDDDDAVWLEIPVARLVPHGDGADRLRAYACDCGGRFVVALEDLDAGYDVIACDGCSRQIRVVGPASSEAAAWTTRVVEEEPTVTVGKACTARTDDAGGTPAMDQNTLRGEPAAGVPAPRHHPSSEMIVEHAEEHSLGVYS